MNSQSLYQAPESPQWQNQSQVDTSPNGDQHPPQQSGYGAPQPYLPMQPQPVIYQPMPQYAGYPGAAAVRQPKNGLAIASLVFGIIGVFTSWLLVGIPFCIVGLVLAAMGKRRSRDKGMAIAGLVLSIIGIVVGIGVFVAIIVSSPSSPSNAAAYSTSTQTLQAYCDAIKAHDAHAAYQLYSSSAQQGTSEDQFKANVEPVLYHITDCTVSNVNENGSTATGTITYTADTGQTGGVDYTLYNENGSWKITSEAAQTG
jgi:hypothetical protein